MVRNIFSYNSEMTIFSFKQKYVLKMLLIKRKFEFCKAHCHKIHSLTLCCLRSACNQAHALRQVWKDWITGSIGIFWSCMWFLICFVFVSHIGDVQFIDYEYSGYNYLAYDIGNHFNEFAGETHTSLLGFLLTVIIRVVLRMRPWVGAAHLPSDLTSWLCLLGEKSFFVICHQKYCTRGMVIACVRRAH